MSSSKAESYYICGKSNHQNDECFYKSAECHRCGRKGHTRAVCRNTGKKPKKEEKTVDEAEEVYDMYHMMEKGLKSYQIYVSLGDKQVTIEVDTGAAR